MKKPLKTFQSCCFFLQAGGIENLLVNWYKATDSARISLDFGASYPTNINQHFVSHVRERGNTFLVAKESSCLLSQKLFYLANLYKLLRKRKYDVFQFHVGGGSLLFLESWIARLAGIKKRYLLIHGPWVERKIPFYRQLMRWNLILTRMRCLAVSEHAGKIFYGDKIPFAVVHPGINTSNFAYCEKTRQQMRAKLGLEHNFVVGHVGRLAPEKNHTFLLDIFQAIYKHDPSARLVLVGEGPREQALRQKARQLQLENQILFMGTQTNPAAYYQAFDTFIFPSLYEGLGLTALEAQASGLPCFVADTVPQAAQICNTTRLSLSKSPEEWAQAVLTQRSDFVRQDCSSKIKEAGFDVACFFAKMEQIYQQ